MAGGAAKVIMSEVDLTTAVPGFPGVYGVITVASKRGDASNPQLCTNETQYLSRYCVNDAVGIGEDMAHYSALAFLSQSNKLWVLRVISDTALYGGAWMPKAGAQSGGNAVPHTPLPAGTADPEAHVFDANAALLIVGKNQGLYNNRISYTLTINPSDPKLFDLVIFFDGKQVESHTASRDPSYKDGYNATTYIEEVIQASEWVNVYDNVAVDASVLPAETKVTTGDEPNTVTTVVKVSLAGGTDGTAVTDGDRIRALDKMRNTNSYPLTILLSGGISTAAYQKNLIEIAEARQDCIAFLNTPFEAEKNADYLNKIVEFRTTTLNANSSYAALYTPHVQIYDKFNDRNIWISPEGYVGAATSSASTNSEIWYPIAGFRRGVLNVLDTYRHFTDGEMDLLADSQINPIRFTPGRGIVIWGQKTLLSRPSRLSKLHVRMVLIVIKPAIKEALEDYEFEFNDVANRQLVTAMIDSYMQGIKGRNGVEDYYIKCDDENNPPAVVDADEMNVYVFVKPKGVAEYINFKTIITPQSMDFSVAEGAV